MGRHQQSVLLLQGLFTGIMTTEVRDTERAGKLAFSSYFPSKTSSITHRQPSPRERPLGQHHLDKYHGASAIGLLAPAGSHTGLLLGVSKHRRGGLQGPSGKVTTRWVMVLRAGHVPGTPPAMMGAVSSE